MTKSRVASAHSCLSIFLGPVAQVANPDSSKKFVSSSAALELHHPSAQETGSSKLYLVAMAQRDVAMAQRDVAMAQRDVAMAQRDVAMAQRDEVFDSTIWQLSKPYRAVRTFISRKA